MVSIMLGLRGQGGDDRKLGNPRPSKSTSTGSRRRSVGTVHDTHLLGRGDHLFWPYSYREAFRSMTARVVADGVELGEQVLYIGWRGVEEAQTDLQRVVHLASLLDERVVRVQAADVLRDGVQSVDHERLLDEIEKAARAAQASGFTGLRLVGDATGLIDAPGGLEEYLSLDQGLERLMADGFGITAVCALDLSALDRDAATEVACVHPAASATLAPFVFHAESEGRFRLAGEVDAWNCECLERILSRAIDSGSTIEVDATDLDFIDHRSLLCLDRWAARRKCSVTLEECKGPAARLAQLLPLESTVAYRA